MVLDEVMRPGLRVVFCGTAAGRASALAGAYYAGPGNAFWSTLYDVGLTPRRLDPADFRELLESGIGLTDLCKTASGSDAEVGIRGFDVPRLERMLEEFSPRWLAFNGKNAARHALDRSVEYGVQPERLGGVAVFVLPSTSGAARRFWDVDRWRELARLVA